MPTDSIHDAVNAHDISAVSKIVAAHPDQINLPNDLGESPLHRAIWEGLPDVASLLLTAGAAVNSAGPNGDTPLHYAAYEDRPPELTELLISCGAELGKKNDASETPLIVASIRSNKQSADVLLTHGAPVDLEIVALLGQAARVREMLKDDPQLRGIRRPGLVLDLVVRRGQKEIASLLLNQGLDPNKGRPPILTAIEIALNDPITDVTMMKLLLDHGADVTGPKVNAKVRDMVGRFSKSNAAKVVAVLINYGYAI